MSVARSLDSGRSGGARAKGSITILCYIKDGSNLVTRAMNGWADPEPAWWLNLLGRPDATVDLADGSRPVRAHAANEDERPRQAGSFSSR